MPTWRRWARADGQQIRKALSTTPGQLRMRTSLVAAGTTLLTLTGAAAVTGAAGAVDRIGHRTAPSIVEAQRLHATLAAADRVAADAFLAGSVGGSAQQRRYEADIATAGEELEQAAEHNAAGDRASGELETVIGMLAEYRGLVETARADNRQDIPLGAAYLRRASALMHRPGDGILARVDSLDALSSDELASETAALWWVAAALAAFLLLAIPTFGLLVWLQAFVRARFRRRRNKRLLGATALLLFTCGWLTAQAVVTYQSLSTAGQQAFPRVQALWQARSLAADANGNESLSLIARGNGAAFDSAFRAETAQLVSGTLTAAAVDRAARGPVLFGGLLAEEVRSASLPGERDAAVAVLRAYRQFLLADGALRAQAAAGDYDGAVAMALGTRVGQLGAAYGDLEGTFDAAIAIVQRSFDRAIAVASPSPVLIAGLPLIGLSVVGLAVWGVRPRLAEYRT